MKQRSSNPAHHGPEFKGVVKKTAGKLTNRPDLEREGREEMARDARRPVAGDSRSTRRARFNPDPHRRG